MGDYALKFIDDDRSRVGGYLVVWGSPAQRDLQGEYFTPESELGLDWYDRRPALYHHGLDGTLKAAAIGLIDTLKADDTGVWAEAQLNLRSRYVQAVQKLVERGILGWSSGSIPHLVEVERDGWIKRWPIVEGSLTPTPSEPRHTGVHPVKAVYDELELDAPVIATLDGKHLLEGVNALKSVDGIEGMIDLAGLAARAGDDVPDATEEDPGGPPSSDNHPSEEETAMDAIKAAVAAALSFMKLEQPLTDEQQNQVHERVKSLLVERTGAEEPPKAAVKSAFGDANFATQVQDIIHEVAGISGDDDEEDVAHAVKAGMGKLIGDSKVKGGGYNGDGTKGQPPADIQVFTRFHGKDAQDMSYYAMLRQMHGRMRDRPPWQPDPPFLREFADKAGKAYESETLELDEGTFKGIKAIKADELNHSTQVGFGDEYVPDLWSNQVWRLSRLNNVIFPLFRSIEMPSNPYNMPVEGDDPIVYYVPETSDEAQLTLGAGNPIPDSKFGTKKVQMDARKLALRMGLSTELEEDAIIPILTHAREKAQRAMMDAVDYAILNGDRETGATGNVNSDDAAPNATDRYLAVNGLLRSALVEDTTRSVDGQGLAPTLAGLRQTRFAMPARYAQNVPNLAWLVSGEVYAKLLGLDEFITMDKAGNLATARTGQIGFVDGIPVLTSAEFGLAEADGKQSAVTPANNIYGRAACVFRPNWIIGFMRRVLVNLEYISYYDAYQMTATLRIALVKQNDDSAAVLYDLAV